MYSVEVINCLHKIYGEIDPDITIDSSFIDFIFENKNHYPPLASTGLKDINDNFKVGDSGGILMNWNFIIVNSNLLQPSADLFKRHKTYCNYTKGSMEYNMFWREETKRRKYGYTANCKVLFEDLPIYLNKDLPKHVRDSVIKSLTITGDFYNYINYTRINRSLTNVEAEEVRRKGGNDKKKIKDFPLVLDGDFWNFEIDNLARLNGKNIIKAKARRKGFTYKESAIAANRCNLFKDTNTIFVAHELAFLTDVNALSDMTKNNLDFYEDHTYWKRGFLSEALDEIRTGYKKEKEQNKKYGFTSSILSIQCKTNTSRAVGKDSEEIVFEESGKNPKLRATIDVTRSSNEDGDINTGIMKIFGTGGSEDADWLDYSILFYEPLQIDALAFENVWDRKSRHTTCGFFYPQVLGYFPYVVDGNSQVIVSYYKDKTKKDYIKAHNKDAKKIAISIGQRANTPEEAFIVTHENIFYSVELGDHAFKLKHNPEYRNYKDGMFIIESKDVIFMNNDELKKRAIITHNFVEDVPFRVGTDVTGCVRLFHEPYRDLNGQIPKGMYLVCYDPFAISKDKNELTYRNSLASISIYELPNNYTGLPFRRIANYTGRMDRVEDVDMLFHKFIRYCNGKGLAEMNRGDVKANFAKWGYMRDLEIDPTPYLQRSDKNITNPEYGIIIGTDDKKREGLGYARELLYTPVTTNEDGSIKYILHYINDLPFIMELLKFNSKGNFDRISEFILYAFKYKSYMQFYKESNAKQNSETKSEKLSTFLNNFRL